MRLRLSRRGRRATAGVTVAAVAAAGIVAYAASGASANYRTAVAALGNVTQVLDLTGTVSPSGRSDLQFGTAGTVSEVLPVGTRVRKGDVVASLDTTQLGRSLVIAQASVAQALAQLSTDQTTLDTPTSTATTASSPTRSRGAGNAAADAALAAAQRACLGGSGGSHAGGPPGSTPSSSPSVSSSPSSAGSPTTSGSATPAPTNSPTVTPTGTTSSGNTAACAAALQQLSIVVHRALATAGSAASKSSGVSTNSGARTVGQSASAHVTQATISRDEASVAQARTKVIQAQQQLTGAVITAPADGTVAETDVTVGAAASAGTTATTVIGAGLTTVTINATLAQVAKLAIDQSASILSTVGTKVATGKVTWIGQLPSSSSTSTFPVVVTLDGNGKALEAGSPVDVGVSLGSANGVITVPTSAVRNGVVTVLDGTKTTTTRVKVGLVGPDRTQITNGLTPGQTVVLADLSTALPTSTVNQTRFGGGPGFGGGLGGPGFGGGTRRAIGG